VTLDEVAQLLRFSFVLPTTRFRGDAEIAHLSIAFEAICHSHAFSKARARAR